MVSVHQYPSSPMTRSATAASSSAAVSALCATLSQYFQLSSETHDSLSDAESVDAFVSQLLAGGCDACPCDSETECVEKPWWSCTDVLNQVSSVACRVHQLAVLLVAWRKTHHHPLLDQPPPPTGLQEEGTSRSRVLAVPAAAVDLMVDTCHSNTEPINSKSSAITAFVHLLGGARGILTLLGLRETPGSRVVCPMTRQQCVTAFMQAHGSVTLTVGARAFSKHCQRSLDGWWGVVKGNDAAKNATALAKLHEILDGAVWQNVHSLPHGEATYEVRIALGYGARWYTRDQSYRGFLEPPMENGHDQGWRH